jgi:DNA invertase Pin-like site-specific DNA recombinase
MPSPHHLLAQGIDTSADSPAGRLQLNVLMAVAEFERGIIRERVSAGIIAAKAQWCKIRATSDHQQPGR